MLRVFDFLFSFFGLLLSFPVLLVIFLIELFDIGSPLFIQDRVGCEKRLFKLVKFRTMLKNTAPAASHLASRESVTKFGGFLRRSKLDELPQLWNVLLGDMSLVGPRPNLFNQHELIQERDVRGVYNVRPGITGLAQIKDIDMSTPELLAKMDAEMISTMSVVNYFKYIFLTVKYIFLIVVGKEQGDRIRL